MLPKMEYLFGKKGNKKNLPINQGGGIPLLTEGSPDNAWVGYFEYIHTDSGLIEMSYEGEWLD